MHRDCPENVATLDPAARLGAAATTTAAVRLIFTTSVECCCRRGGGKGVNEISQNREKTPTSAFTSKNL